jgi:hypothetical protein
MGEHPRGSVSSVECFNVFLYGTFSLGNVFFGECSLHGTFSLREVFAMGCFLDELFTL